MSRRNKKHNKVAEVIPPPPSDHTKYARVRLRNPNNPTMYYNKENGHWVKQGYTIWELEEWRERFPNEQPKWLHWEFYGELIDIWEGYSEE